MNQEGEAAKTLFLFRASHSRCMRTALEERRRCAPSQHPLCWDREGNFMSAGSSPWHSTWHVPIRKCSEFLLRASARQGLLGLNPAKADGGKLQIPRLATHAMSSEHDLSLYVWFKWQTHFFPPLSLYKIRVWRLQRKDIMKQWVNCCSLFCNTYSSWNTSSKPLLSTTPQRK